MQLKIVDITPEDMHKTAIMSRAKSPVVRMLYAEVFELTKDTAKSLVLEDDEDFDKTRVILSQCSKRAGVDLDIVPDRPKNRILFKLKQGGTGVRRQPSPPNSLTARDMEEMRKRSNAIQNAALELGRRQMVVSAQEVVDHLKEKEYDLDVPRPTTSVSAVMRNMREFEHTDKGQFRFRGF